jgi:hypothetical protein
MQGEYAIGCTPDVLLWIVVPDHENRDIAVVANCSFQRSKTTHVSRWHAARVSG